MRILCLFFLIYLCSLGEALAQSAIDISNQNLETLTSNDDSDNGELLVTIFEGNNNQVFIEQAGLNVIDTKIIGDDNAQYINQVGSLSTISIIQNGDNNQLILDYDGDYIYGTYKQEGNYNSIIQNITGSHQQYNISQTGSYLQFEHSSNTTSSIPVLDIQMTGDDMTILIDSKNF